ncbi:hypothetical protein, partial [Bifidobacterium pullorum]|uniref:hypothetical protein n=1 Tax=Bifidobacterium pullorum TaxID=78448 RepID=UPI0019579918
AIYCYRRIIEIGRRKNAKKDVCTNPLLVPAFVNDSKFQLYRLYHDKADYRRSRFYSTLYKKGLAKGVATLFTPLEDFLME